MTTGQQQDGFLERFNQAFEAATERGLTSRLARRCGVSEQAVGRWRRKGNIARENLGAVADELGVTADWLLTGSGPMRAEDRDAASRVAPLIGDTVAGVDPTQIGAAPGACDPVVPVGYRGEASIYAVRVDDAPDLSPRYTAGEVVIVLAGGALLSGFDVFIQWLERDGARAGLRHLAWSYDREVALDPVVPGDGRGRRQICLLDELVVCHPVYGRVPPWVVERCYK